MMLPFCRLKTRSAIQRCFNGLRQRLPASTTHSRHLSLPSITSGAASHTPGHRKILEVERKFVPSSHAISILKEQDKWPGPEPVKRLSPQNGYVFTDIYRDTPDSFLFRARIYVRQRKEKWQMKMHRAGDMVSTGCIEVVGGANIESALRTRGIRVSLSDLKAVARIETVRGDWKVGDFNISLDDAVLLLDGHGASEGKLRRIAHSVGEVEICEEVEEESAESRMKEMAKEVDDFMRRYEEVFKERHDGRSAQIPEGKLAAYIRWQRILSEQYLLPEFR